jgi:hypothetical protein
MVVAATAIGIGRVKVPRDILHYAFHLQLHIFQFFRSMLAQEL